MDLTDISIQPAYPQRHFATIAVLIFSQEIEPSTQQTLLEWYSKQLDDAIQFTAAESSEGKVLGFNGIYRDNSNLERHYGRYRGRKLAQVVKSLALCKALTLEVQTVRTSDNSENAAMIAIDTKLGYVHTPGTLIMVKE